jgi:hypothetical protein
MFCENMKRIKVGLEESSKAVNASVSIEYDNVDSIDLSEVEQYFQKLQEYAVSKSIQKNK